ncbi:MAG: nucleotidyl transferase AbiEii/AbiGii toxin family protein [Clostridiales bacterium]|nr:nucleotidyl transferase AbiEii/AbiGii toxin family protein [Clostridiales bacterium]
MKEYLASVVSGVPRQAATNVMREYLQARVLQTLQDRGAWEYLAFHGGTALRFLYAIPRFSEDLDFALEVDAAKYDFTALLEAVRTRFEREAYNVTLKVATKTTVNKAFVRFVGLEHELGLSPQRDKTFSVKIEVDTNPPAGAVVEVTTVRRYATLRLAHHDRSSLLAGKIAALLLREWIKGRDVYDLVWYLSDPSWPEPNEVLLANACVQAGRTELAHEGAWRSALYARMREAPWDHVLTDVERFLERDADRWMLERETVLGVLRQRGVGEGQEA